MLVRGFEHRFSQVNEIHPAQPYLSECRVAPRACFAVADQAALPGRLLRLPLFLHRKDFD
jgi:hypothetical protein